jgi:hypothetical protein
VLSAHRQFGTAASILAVAAALALLLVAPPAARPAPHKVHGQFPESVSESIHLSSSNGYRLAVTGWRTHFSAAETAKFSVPGRGAESEPAPEPEPLTETTWFLTLRRGPAQVTYFPAGPTISGGITEASLGGLGKVALRFVPRRVTRKRPQKGCTGGADRIEHGVFVGVFRLRGEGGYTSVSRHAMRGTLTRQPPLSCDLVPTESREPNGTRVEGTLVHGEDGIGFSAKRLTPQGAAHFYASESERRGKLTIQRTISKDGAAGSVLIDGGLTTATVDPPAPFQGEAHFKAFSGKQSGTWLGPLSVSFPGKPDVRLAGKDFEGSLLTGTQCSVDPGVMCVGLRGS